MGNKNNFIELNGKRYDAVTGEVVASAPPTHHALVKRETPKRQQRMDDIVRTHAAPSPAPVVRATPAKQPLKTVTKPVMDVIRAPKASLAHHQPQHAKTLMRHVVQKPKDSLKRHTKVQTRTDILVKKPVMAVLPKLSYHNVDPSRLKRAERIAQSQLIRRFAPLQPSNLLTASSSTASLSVAAAPAVHVPHTQKHVAPQSQNHSMDIFERALVHANSHEQPTVHPKKHAKAHSKRKRGILGHRAMSSSALVVAVLLVAGFIGLQNKANVTMRIASSRAGFHATLPGYKPSGFAVGAFNYSPGVVAVNFTSNSDARSFKLTQKTSNWDSQALLNNYVAVAAPQYQAFQDGGRTVYIYGNNDATWVNNGVWYQVNDNGNLSTNQVLQLAQSM